MGIVRLEDVPPDGFPHPNEFDRHRIMRSLGTRRRYRYVEPRVVSINGGYKIESPCCSRNIDPEGGVVDVALLLFEMERWNLYRKEHAADTWQVEMSFQRLSDLLAHLNDDPDRRFWQ